MTAKIKYSTNSKIKTQLRTGGPKFEAHCKTPPCTIMHLVHVLFVVGEISSKFPFKLYLWAQNTDTYRMFTPIGANGKLLTLNFHIDTGAATNSTNN